MKITIVEVMVKKDNISDFITASAANHEASIQESGNQRFDVLQSPENECKFILYEAYNTAEDAAAHKQTAHYLEWRKTVADWMAEPRKGIAYTGLYPK